MDRRPCCPRPSVRRRTYRTHRRTMAALLVTGCATTVLGCSAPAAPRSADSTPAGTSPTSTAVDAGAVPAAQAGGQTAGRGSGHGGAHASIAAVLPPTWPQEVPVPPGRLVSSTAGVGHWSLLLLTPGPVAMTHQDAVAFYRRAGFVPLSASVLVHGGWRVVLVGTSRDHPDVAAYLAVGLTRP